MTWNKGKIIDLLVRAGDVARRSRKNLRREIKADASIVTQADREIEGLLSSELEDTAEGVYIIGEETVADKGEEYIDRALRREAYVIDPIDGTSPYANGMPNWGVSIGYMRDGVLEQGAVYLPDLGEMITTEGDVVLEGVLEAGDWRWRELARPVREQGHSRLIGITQMLAKTGTVRLKNPVQVLGAAVVPLAGLLQERFSAYLGSVKLWDVAGALPAILRNGFSITVREGDEIRRVTGEVTESTYHLRAGDRKRWQFRSELLICHPDDEQRMRKAFSEGAREHGGVERERSG